MVQLLHEDENIIVGRQPDGKIVKILDGNIIVVYKDFDEKTKEAKVGIDDLILMSQTLRTINRSLRNENSQLKRELKKAMIEAFNIQASQCIKNIPDEEIPCLCDDKLGILDLGKLISEQKEREKNIQRVLKNDNFY